MKSYILSLATMAISLLSGCVSHNLDKYYAPIECAETIPWNAEPTLELRTGDPKNDIYKMLDEDYVAIGSCVFEGGEYDSYAKQIRRMAKVRLIEKVLIYAKYDRTESGTTAIPITTYNTSTITTTSTLSGYSTSLITTPNTTMIPLSYSNRRYVYHVLFYRKLQNSPKLGVLFGELTEEESKLAGSRDYMKVIYVCRNKAGWRSNIFKDDIVLSVNGCRPTIEYIRKATDEGLIKFKILRDGKQIFVTVKI